MAENNEEITQVEPGTQDPGPTPTPAVDELAELKTFLGDAYKEGMTLQEVSAFLKGKKYADLNTGNYVSKRKYDDLEKAHNSYKESTKDYESIKQEIAGYKAEKEKAELIKQAEAANINVQFIEYALAQIKPDEKDKGTALKEWAKANPQFLNMETKKIYIDSNPSHEKGNKPKKTFNQMINENIRAAAGKNQD